MSIAFELEIISTSARLRETLGEWNAFIASDDVEAGLFCDPRVIEGTLDFEAGQQLVLVTRRAEGVKAGMIPFKRSRRRVRLAVGMWRIGSVAATVLSLCDFEFPVRRGTDRFSMLAGASALIRRNVPCDLLVAENCAVPGPNAASGQAARLGRRILLSNLQRTYTLVMPESFESYLSGLRPKSRGNLRRQVSKLEGAAGNALALRRYSRPEAMEELIAHVAAVWNKSWHSKFGGGPPAAAFLKGFARAGWVRSYVLFARQEPVAFVVGYQYKGRYYYESIAYDPAWQQYSPGAVLTYLMLEELFSRDRPDIVDFGFGYNQYKEVLGNRPEDRAEIRMPLSNHGAAIVRCIGTLQEVYRTGKAVAATTGLAGRLRSLRRGTSPRPEGRAGLRARLAGLARRIRVQGIRQSLSYVLVTVLMERLGLHIYRVFEAADEDASGFAAKGLETAMLKGMASLSSADTEALKSYGGPRLLRHFEAGFARQEACVAARLDDGRLAGVAWLTSARDYAPARRSECALLERCFTFPEYRGRGVFPALLAYAVRWNRERHPERGAPLVECSISNASSARGILKAGFKPVGVLVMAWRWKHFWRRRSVDGPVRAREEAR